MPEANPDQTQTPLPEQGATLAPTAVEKADVYWAKAKDCAQKREFDGAILAGNKAVELVGTDDLDRYGEWKRQIEFWQTQTGDKAAGEKTLLRGVLRVVPVWLWLAVSGLAAIGLSGTWFVTWREQRQRDADIVGELSAGADALDRGLLDEAQKHFDKAQKRGPDDPRPKLGSLIRDFYDAKQQGEYSADAVDVRLTDLAHKARGVPLLRGHVLTIQGNVLFHDALDSGVAASQHTLSAERLGSNGAAAVERRDADVSRKAAATKLAEAAAQYELAIQARRSIVEAHVNLGAVRAYQRRYDDAKREYEEAHELAPKNIDALSGLGFVATAQTKYDEARRWSGQILATEPDRLQTRLELATLLRILGRFEDALSQQKQVAAEFAAFIDKPKNAQPWALFVYGNGPQEPWIATSADQKRWYLQRNLAATECMLEPAERVSQQESVDPTRATETPLSREDRESIRTLVRLELEKIAAQVPAQAERVRSCVARQERAETPTVEPP